MSLENIKRTSFTEANYQTAIRLDIGCSATAAAVIPVEYLCGCSDENGLIDVSDRNLEEDRNIRYGCI